MLRAFATRGTWNRAASGEMCGSRPLPEVVTRSIGTGADGFSSLSFSTSPLTRSISALLVGPRFEPPSSRHCRARRRSWSESFGSGAIVADGRPWKYLSLGEDLSDQRRADDLAVLLDQAALRLVREDRPRRCRSWPADRARPVMSVRATMNTIAGRISFNMTASPQARCRAVTTRSMALMPMNGMMTPPTP